MLPVDITAIIGAMLDASALQVEGAPPEETEAPAAKAPESVAVVVYAPPERAEPAVQEAVAKVANEAAAADKVEKVEEHKGEEVAKEEKKEEVKP